jgi:hypothetical protein
MKLLVLGATYERRGWGLKLIRTLMDEVEFEKVDDRTGSRMTKYIRDACGACGMLRGVRHAADVQHRLFAP